MRLRSRSKPKYKSQPVDGPLARRLQPRIASCGSFLAEISRWTLNLPDDLANAEIGQLQSVVRRLLRSMVRRFSSQNGHSCSIQTSFAGPKPPFRKPAVAARMPRRKPDVGEYEAPMPAVVLDQAYFDRPGAYRFESRI
jgi:hypothetical protein